MNMEMISKETIKPSFPTPQHIRTVNLSFCDIFAPSIYVPTVYFFNTCLISNEVLSNKLKKSLSEILTRFYPFAGRLIKGVFIECNDEGAVFLDARIDCLLSDFLKSPDQESLQQLLPVDIVTSAATWPLLLVKANFFRCGGLAIAVCLSHKISGAPSLAMFVHEWAAAARGCIQTVKNPEFTMSTLLPPVELSSTFTEVPQLYKERCVSKRFMFDGSKIAELKIKAASALVKDPTRVEAVTALVWKCMSKASSSNSGTSRPSVLQQTADFLRRIPSLRSKNVIGNVTFLFFAKHEDHEPEIQGIAKELRRKKEEFNEMLKESIIEKDVAGLSLLGVKVLKEMASVHSRAKEINLYTVTTWCRMPFYEADFGWGNPAWVTVVGPPVIGNSVVLMDAKDEEGIEAWVTLPEQDMSVFEHNPELLAFASPSPSILIESPSC